MQQNSAAFSHDNGKCARDTGYCSRADFICDELPYSALVRARLGLTNILPHQVACCQAVRRDRRPPRRRRVEDAARAAYARKSAPDATR
jgi:CxxC motif-containing protein (DUF1111 family)